MLALVFAAIAASAYGVSDYLGGLAARKTTALTVIAVSYPLSVVLTFALASALGGDPTAAGWAWGVGSGLAAGIAVWAFYVALSEGPMSVVSPVSAVLAAAVPVLVGLSLGERIGLLGSAGIALAITASVLVTVEADQPGRIRPFTPRVAGFAVLSGLTFSAYFVLIGQVGPGQGLWPVAASRVGATAVVAAMALLAVCRARKSNREHQLRPAQLAMMATPAAVIAVADVIANSAFYYGAINGPLSRVSVIAALYPAVTIALALIHGKERLRLVQLVGVGAAVIAIPLIGVGAEG